MARTSKRPPDPEEKSKKADKLFEQFVESIKDKRTVISGAAIEARNALRSIRNSKSQTDTELKKIQANASKDVGSLKAGVATVAVKAKADIKTAFTEVDQTRDETRKSYNKFKRTYDAAMNGERGINARRDDVIVRHEKIKTVHKDIDDLAGKTRERAADVKNAHATALTDRDEITKVKDRANDIKEEIENTYHITVDAAMGGALNERKIEIQKGLKFWRLALIVSVLILVAAIGVLIAISVQEGGDTNLLEAVTNRLVYLTPLLFVILITYKQYNHERRVIEEYAFKASMAQSLRNYSVLLSDNYKHVSGAEEKILDFLLKSMTNIYDRSSLDNKSGLFYQLIVGSKHLGAQATVQEGTVETEQTTKVETKKQTKSAN
jgi:hypothetical protein